MEKLWLDWVLPMLVGLAVLWTALVYALWRSRPDDLGLRAALRLLPDLIRLIRRLAGDRSLAPGIRIRLWLLLGHLSLPIDLVPDFVPMLGLVDDAVIVVLTLRWVIRSTGPAILDKHWPGSAEGLQALRRVAGLSTS